MYMKKVYIITGANGHLGNTIIRMLKEKEELVIGFILPQEKGSIIGENISYVQGDIRNKGDICRLFEQVENYEVIVIHCAGIISIADDISDDIYDVNVKGTKNLLEISMEKQVSRFLYVSSVHAIPEGDKLHVLRETNQFSDKMVHGAYAKTKAIATKMVLQYVKKGLNAIIVHPSGILGPYNDTGNHLVQLISDYANGKLPFCVNGGYDFVDVRDVADGCLKAIEKGRIGECYILSNRHYEVKEVLEIVQNIQQGRKAIILPTWLARLGLPFIKIDAKLRNKRPLYTKYSLYTLASDDKFSHYKATTELDYHPRDLYITIKDTLDWLNSKKRKKVFTKD